MFHLERDADALQEVVEANPGTELVFSYSADLYLGDLSFPGIMESADGSKEESNQELQSID